MQENFFSSYEVVSYIVFQFVHKLSQLGFEFTPNADEGKFPLLTGIVGELSSEELVVTFLN